MADKPLLGDLLVQQKLASQDVVDKALKIQVGGTRRLGYILVRMKEITEDQLADTLANQMGISVCNIDEAFSPEVSKLLPRYICRQFSVLPLSLQDNNILEVAMANPADYDAINDLEHYTGKVINANLARNSEIEREIPKRIKFSHKDVFSPQANNFLTKAVAAIALILAVGIGIYTYDYIQKARHGTVSVADNMLLYQHHDITLAVDDTGKYSLLGHGAYADGLYKISFSSLESLNAFIKKHERDFSTQQKEWLQWAMKQASSSADKEIVVQK